MEYSKASVTRYGPVGSGHLLPATAAGFPSIGTRPVVNSQPRNSNVNNATRITNSGGIYDGWGWNEPEADDYLHNPDPKRDRRNERGGSIFTARGFVNVGCLTLLMVCLITLFAGYPIISAVTDSPLSTNGAFNLGGINSTGQIPLISNFPSLIDPDTPQDVYQRTGFDGQKYNLVFSDEFNKDGRTFYPGDDPYWTAVDLHYWPTGDLEWYDPAAITTEGGHLKITMAQEVQHDLNFKSGMLQSWNQLCFQWSYYLEVSVSLPGTNDVGGFWPGVWTMGNLGRPGYGATTDGLWPYTYDSCDVGILPNQTWPNGTSPAPALDTGEESKGGALSYLPGQRLSSCTCPGEDHPGPDVTVGRGAPEIDVIEAQIDISEAKGEMSQSAQVAPFDDYWQFNNDSTGVRVWTKDITHWNTYLGSVFQQAVSGLTYVTDDVYRDTSGNFNVYGVEVWADPNDRNAGVITWASGGEKTWTMYAASVGPNPRTEIGQRLISEEPMAVIINFGMSNNFQNVDLAHLTFPNYMLVDYVRVYQRPGGKIGCDPSDHPTAQYIARHREIYDNANLTTWPQAGQTFPRNRLTSTC